MIVERKDNEILLRCSAGNKASKIQAILDYLRYEELTSKSEVREEDLASLWKENKKGRLGKFKEETRLSDKEFQLV